MNQMNRSGIKNRKIRKYRGLSVFLVCILVMSFVCACGAKSDETVSEQFGESEKNASGNSSEAVGAEDDADTFSSENADNLEMAQVKYDDEDLDPSWDDSAVQIALDDEQTKISGTGASYADNILTIKSAGTYVISGTLSDDQWQRRTDG